MELPKYKWVGAYVRACTKTTCVEKRLGYVLTTCILFQARLSIISLGDPLDF